MSEQNLQNHFGMPVHDQQGFPLEPPLVTNQQKRQHSNSYNIPIATKRTVTQPNSPLFLNAMPSSAVEQRPLTAGVVHTPVTNLPSSVQSPLPPQHRHTAAPQQQQQQQQFHQQMLSQVPQFKPSFTVTASAVPQIQQTKNNNNNSSKFSQTFVNSTYQKPQSEIPNSPSLSTNKPRFETSSYLNDDRTDVNDYDTNSLAYTQPTVVPQQQIHQNVASSRQPPHILQQSMKASPAVLTKDAANADSPGSTISDASNPVVPPSEQPQSKLSEEEQSLITKLQDTYKNIIRLENTLQRKCASLNVPQRLDTMNELWDVYNINIQLLNSYYDFLLYSMSSGKSGKQIVQVYRIPRRLWVYGIVTFLDVIKNVVSIFIEHDICSSFIGYAFNILSGLTDLDMDGWMSEKLGDLSRMAIALYPSRYIDWKISSEYWYTQAMKTQYGYGKIYYHIATVQQDSLDALVNIGKSVFCRETFVPTPQYMRMVIDNINQRSYIDLPVLDFTKVYKLLLTGEINDVFELNKLITYYTQNLGVDNNNIDFFTRVPGSISEVITSPEYSQGNDYENKFQFWLQRSSSFALANISLMVGFGAPTNPFARLFGLLEALKERKNRKEKKDKRKKSNDEGASNGALPHLEPESTTTDEEIKELTVEEWFSTHSALDKVVVKLSMKMFETYLKGPVIAALPHVITLLYFVVAVGEATRKKPNSRPFFETIMNMFLPCGALINYLNDVLTFVRSQDGFLGLLKIYNAEDATYVNGGFLSYHNKKEILIEVWKCWGTLWFDALDLKEEFSDAKSAGVAKHDLLDVPIGGARYDQKMNGDRFLRVLLLASYIADNFNFGIKRSSDFKFHNHVEKILERTALSTEADKYVENTYTELAQQAKALGLIESSFADKSAEKSVTGNLLGWIKGNGVDSNQAELGIVNYAQDDADNEDSEDDSIHSDIGDGTELDELINELASDDSLEHLTLRVITAESGIMIGSTLTYFVLDTNLWLKHCGKLFKSLRNEIFKLAVPLVVFQELRSLRCSSEANVSDAATRAVIALRQLAADNLLIPLKMDGTEAPSLNDVTDFENNTSWVHNIDETIIRSTKFLGDNLLSMHRSRINKDITPISLTVLISEDRAMRLQSRVNKVPAFQGKWFFQVVERLSDGRSYN
jgi:hypothetical protein